jgi:hypothetical protein
MKWAHARLRPNDVVSNCRTIVSILDAVEELRPLLLVESHLRTHVKARLSLAYKELEAYWRQRYTYRLCKLGDAGTLPSSTLVLSLIFAGTK